MADIIPSVRNRSRQNADPNLRYPFNEIFDVAIPSLFFSDYAFKYHRIDLIYPEKPCSHFGSYAAKGKYTFHTHSKTSTNGHLSTTVAYLGPRGRFVHLLLFQPLFNGHLSTMATATKIVSQLSK